MSAGDYPGELPSWLMPSFNNLIQRQRSGTLPHALLLSGQKGIGKQRLAQVLMKAVCCDALNKNGFACQQCRSCQLIEAGSHPDVKNINPVETGKVISIDQIRALNQYVLLKAQLSGNKVAVISPAEQMNIASSNSLLKTLEEPPAHSLLVLVTSRPAMLPATIRSRCQNIVLHKPTMDVGVQWLKTHIDSPKDHLELLLSLADGAPFEAKKLADNDLLKHRDKMLSDLEGLIRGQNDPVSIAEAWLKVGMSDSLYWLRRWVEDLLRLKSSENLSNIVNSDVRGRLEKVAHLWDLKPLFRFYDQLCETIRLCETSCNPQMLLEDLLIFWTHRRIPIVMV
ncbi:MAG: DNA polymerase III subunit delta' [Gammaproteobacteria bacterium]|nr:DNA polymerase III subunit delta' [Gammaproteobacteria bacterium]